MTELPALSGALLAGLLLGLFFFGGLWWTLRICMASAWAAPCLLFSLLLRTALVMAGFYYVMGENWQQLLAGLLGFTIARFIVTRLTRIAPQNTTQPQKADHAP